MNEQSIAVQYLMARTVTLSTAAENNVEIHSKSEGEGRIKASEYRRRLGFDNWHSGPFDKIIDESIWFPCRDANSTIHSWILRPFPELPAKNGEKPTKSLTQKDSGGYPFIPAATWAVASKPTQPLLITEGPVKTLAALQAGAYPIGINGVWMATCKDGETGATSLHPAIRDNFNLSGRTVYLAFDADYSENPNVLKGLIRTSILLIKAGADDKILTWPLEEGNGLDDYLAGQSDRNQALKSLCESAGDLSRILRECDLDSVKKEIRRARLAGSKLSQFCKLVSKPLSVRPSVLEQECTQPEPNEEERVAILEAEIPPILVWEKEWYAFNEGFWKKTNKDIFKPAALKTMPARSRTARKAKETLDHLEGLRQSPSDCFRDASRFDGEDILLNISGGVLRIRPDATVQLEPAAKEHYFCAQLPCVYDEDSDCPLFSRTLAEALPDPLDQELFLYWCASILLPSSRFEAALCCYGAGGTGKSTLAFGIRSVLGPTVTRFLSLKEMCSEQGYHVPELRHSMLNISTELDAVLIENSEIFKRLISGEEFMARNIYGKPFVMQSTCKPLFLTNHLPRFKSGTDAELRRLRFLRFEHPPSEIDPTLKEVKIPLERNGIFRLLVAYLLKLLSMKAMPHGGERSEVTLKRFAITNDPLGSFVKERCVLDPQDFIAKSELLNHFTDYLEELGLPATIGDSFFKFLYDRYPDIKRKRPRNGKERERVLFGIGMKTDL